MERKPFVVPEVLEHESLTGLTLQSPTGCLGGGDRDCDGVHDNFDRFPDDPSRF